MKMAGAPRPTESSSVIPAPALYKALAAELAIFAMAISLIFVMS